MSLSLSVTTITSRRISTAGLVASSWGAAGHLGLGQWEGGVGKGVEVSCLVDQVLHLCCQVTLSGKELQEKNHKSNKLAALFFNKGSNKVRRK